MKRDQKPVRCTRNCEAVVRGFEPRITKLGQQAMLWTIAVACQQVDDQWTTNKRKGARLSSNPLFYLAPQRGLEPRTR